MATLKSFLEGYREIKRLNQEFAVLFELVGMNFKNLSGKAQNMLRMNALSYGPKQTFVATLPTFAENGLLKMNVEEATRRIAVYDLTKYLNGR